MRKTVRRCCCVTCLVCKGKAEYRAALWMALPVWCLSCRGAAASDGFLLSWFNQVAGNEELVLIAGKAFTGFGLFGFVLV
jgi:hypothetical protein